MVKTAELKVDQLRYLAAAGSRPELVQRLVEFEESEDVEMPQASGNVSQREESVTSQAAAISQLQNEMTELKNMKMAQLVSMQRPNADDGVNRQQRTEETRRNITGDDIPNLQARNNVRQASVKEIADTLPEFNPGDENAISVNQFIDRVNKVVGAYHWDETFLLLAIYTKIKGPAKMWFDSSPVVHTTWSDFAQAMRDEFGASPDEAEVHFNMTNATRRAKETVKEYCFRMSALGVRYSLSEAAVIRYVRAGLQHRELQNCIAAIHFSTMKQLRDAAESYFVNRGRTTANKKEFVPKYNKFEMKQDSDVKTAKPKDLKTCFKCGELGHFANSCPNTGSQASIIRQSVADELKVDRHECSMRIRGICGGSCILSEEVVIHMDVEGKTIDAKLYVADDELLQEDLLLGQDVIVSAQLSLKFTAEDVEVKRAVQQAETIGSERGTHKLLVNIQNNQERSQMNQLLSKFEDVFSTRLQGIGKTNIVQAKIDVESNQVVSQPPYRIPEPKKEVVAKMLDELLQQDIIQQSTSEYASPVVLIKKPNGSDRLCVGYRRLNKRLKKENFPVPNIEERLQEAKRY
ncbi:uncharacterized protein LOC123258220 [Drosophila ananassae]|uniref:uncharacterized protein LOC123258220 n=1 Tax=Drosophila ananassae TaxID=7217 RepID=UPI001CFFE8D1|nr:uncharacterized protein LOC123258220 [Drosophila ananassae]